MKTIKRVISLVMAVIMLITGTPVLQASDLAFDRAQMKELQKEISQDVKVGIYVDELPVKLMNRYKQAKKNSELMLKKLNKIQLTEEQQKAAEEFINQLKEKAEELAKTEEYEIVPKPERQAAAFNSILFDSILFDGDEYHGLGYCGANMIVIGALTGGLGLIISEIALNIDILPLWLGDVGIYAVQGGTVLVFIGLGLLIISLFSGAYRTVMDFGLDAKETAEVFSKKPFVFLSKFENEVEYRNLYNKCPELLQDAVDIEYYTSLNVTPQNMKEKLYIGSLEWYKASTEERAAYLHEFAERLRDEAKSFRW